MKYLIMSAVTVIIGIIVTVIVNDHYFTISEPATWAKTMRGVVMFWWGGFALWAYYYSTVKKN